MYDYRPIFSELVKQFQHSGKVSASYKNASQLLELRFLFPQTRISPTDQSQQNPYLLFDHVLKTNYWLRSVKKLSEIKN